MGKNKKARIASSKSAQKYKVIRRFWYVEKPNGNLGFKSRYEKTKIE